MYNLSQFFLNFLSQKSDRGTEFALITNEKFKEEYELEVYLTKDTVVKNSLTEIANRLLQDRLYKNMTATHTNNWIDHLGNIVVGINNMKRRILFGYSSSEIKNDENVLSIVQKKSMLKLHEYNDRFASQRKKFRVGDNVKIVRKHTIFQKGYTNKTTDEVDVIKKILDTSPPTYLLQGKRRPYYSFELIQFSPTSSINDDNDYYIDEEKPITRRQLRSGTSGSSDERLYTLKSRKDPDFKQTIDEKEKLHLMRDGNLRVIPSGE